jgi:hypothetical protein
VERCGYDIKGSTFVSYMKSIQSMNLLDEIRGKLCADTRKLLEHPPLPGVWMDGWPVEEMNGAVAQLRGLDILPSISARAMATGMTPILRPVVEGMMRLFGMSPAALFSRLPTISRSSVRGIEFMWKGETDNSGVMAVRLPRPDAGLHVLYPFCGSFEHTCVITGRKGTVAKPDVTRDAHTTARYRISWT